MEGRKVKGWTGRSLETLLGAMRPTLLGAGVAQMETEFWVLSTGFRVLGAGFWVLGPTVVAQLGGGSGAETANSAKPTPAAATKRHKLILFFLLIRFGSHKSSQKSTLSHLLNIYEKTSRLHFKTFSNTLSNLVDGSRPIQSFLSNILF